VVVTGRGEVELTHMEAFIEKEMGKMERREREEVIIFKLANLLQLLFHIINVNTSVNSKIDLDGKFMSDFIPIKRNFG
jgi:hypothetical protein